MYVLNLARPTQGDINFYKRWETFGQVFGNFKEVQNKLNAIDVLVVDQYTTIDDNHLRLFPNLKYICSPTTGHTHLIYDDQKHIKTFTLRGEVKFLEGITSVAEFTLFLILRLAREVSQHPIRLKGKTLAIIGFGRIGEQVANIGQAFGMKIKTYDKLDSIHHLKSIFMGADFISVHLDENPTTRWLVSKELIYSMKRSAFLINTSRGSVINERALMRSLIKGKIAGAAIDVRSHNIYLNEKVPNLIISEHIAGRCLEDRISTDEFIIEKLKTEVLRGLSPRLESKPLLH